METMLGVIRSVYELYGFEPLDTPAFEYSDALGKFLPDADRPNEGVFSFQDEDEDWVSLRYDLTAPLARFVAANYDGLPKPYRRYQTGPVWRNEKPGPGRFRQFIQFDADTVGAASMAADAEMCMLAADTLEKLGIPNGGFLIKINNRKILDGMLDGANIPQEKRLTVLRAFDKLDRIGREGVTQLLGKGRKDESGDFTKGADLEPEQIKTLEEKYLNSIVGRPLKDVTEDPEEIERLGNRVRKFGPLDGSRDPNYFVVDNDYTISTLKRLFHGFDLAIKGIEEIDEIQKWCKSSGYDEQKIVVDPSVVRGLEYYTGPVFEAELTFEVKGDDGAPMRFGSVGGGGRYDGLVERFKGVRIPATGFSIGVSRLFAALKALDKLNVKDQRGPAVVMVMDRDRLGDYQRIVKELRGAGVRAELYLGDSGLKAQMKYADKRGAPCVVIQGEEERQRGEAQIKDLIEGRRLSEEIADNAKWREARPAQFSVKTAEIVAAVQGVIARHEA